MKEVMLKIEGIQKSSQGEKNTIELMTEGKFYEKQNAIYLVYKETEISGMEGSTTTVKLMKDKISMKRFGTAASEIVFEEGKRYITHYHTPYGNFGMEILTKHMNYAINDANKGSVYIEYEMKLQGVVESTNQLNIQII